MKGLLPILLGLVCVGASAADTPSLAGSWTVHISVSGNESEMNCTFTLKDKDLAGSCSAEQGTVNITGKIDDKKVNWTYKSEYQGSPLTLTYAGTLDASNKINGTVRVEEYNVDGDFTARQVK